MNTSEDILHIHTPENVAFGYEVAGIGSRFLAAIVDTLLILALEAFISIAAILGSRYLNAAGLDESLNMWVIAIVGLILFFVFWGYYILFEMLWNGQTPGKRLAGLRVIRANGAPISLAESTIRNLVRLIDFIPSLYGVGVVVMFIDRQSRRLGDLAAGTLVVRDHSSITLESLAASPLKSTFHAPGASEYPVHLLTANDVQLAEEFLRRRGELFNRQELAPRIARTLAEHMRLPSEEIDSAYKAEIMIERIIQSVRSKPTEEG